VTNSLSPPPKPDHLFKRVAILFAGGPAPAANAVISAAAASFLRAGVEVVGIKHGYSNLIDFDPANPLVEDQDYVQLTHKFLARSRNKRGILIGTARSNPGKFIKAPADFSNSEKSGPLKNVYDALRSIGCDALISIGGDDTLKTANKFKLFQEHHSEHCTEVVPVVHLPKTIDNDYHGIDFTDAEATNSYFLCESMGRSAGWLSYGAAIAGEASLVVSVEDINGDYEDTEEVTDADGNTITRKIMNVERVIDRIVKTMHAREAEGKKFGVVVVAEGLAEFLPQSYLTGAERDEHGHISITSIKLYEIFSNLVAAAYEKQTGTERKVKGLQLGYESRCAQPHAFDVMLGSQLGVGAFRALAEEKLNGVMVSVSGQLDLHYEPFEKLVDPNTLVTVVRYIEAGSDFHRLARFLETHVND